MKTVLLAIAGEKPNREALTYALDLCRKMKARLNVLQVVAPGKPNRTLKSMSDCAKRFSISFEKTMVAAAFAEAGEHEFAKSELERIGALTAEILCEKDKTGIIDELIVKTGKAAKETLNYIRYHSNIILAIYDPSLDVKKRKRSSGIPEVIKRNAEIPVLMVQA